MTPRDTRQPAGESAPGREAREELHQRYEDRLRPSQNLRRLASFAGNREEPVHRWFPYKEGFSRGLVARAMEAADLARSATVLDPFCGVGTTPLTARLSGHRALGADLLPLATFVASTKLRAVECSPVSALRRALDSLPGQASRGISRFAAKVR